MLLVVGSTAVDLLTFLIPTTLLFLLLYLLLTRHWTYTGVINSLAGVTYYRLPLPAW